jgi:hypothetical protein
LKVEKGTRLIMEEEADFTIGPGEALRAKDGEAGDADWVEIEYGKVEEVSRDDLPEGYTAPAYGTGEARRISVRCGRIAGRGRRRLGRVHAIVEHRRSRRSE